MTLAGLGRAEAARMVLKELREWLKTGRWGSSPYVLEAERVVGAVRLDDGGR